MRLVAGLLVLLTASACGQPTASFVDDVSSVEFGGQQYQGGPATGYEFVVSDIAAIGRASEIQAGVGPEVFRLIGVDPRKVIVLKGDGSEPGLWIFFAPGVLAMEGPPLAPLPELCRYVTAAARPDLCGA